jgi:hypothetical protein
MSDKQKVVITGEVENFIKSQYAEKSRAGWSERYWGTWDYRRREGMAKNVYEDHVCNEAMDMGMVTIEDDRYGQTGYRWLAWRCAAEDVPVYDIPDDNEREAFWRDYKGIVGLGNTPNDAVVDLYNKVKEYQDGTK